MPAVIGGERAWKKRAKGDIGISYEWVNGEPAMILFPIHGNRRTSGAYAICLSAAFKYAKSNGYPDEAYCVEAGRTAAETMGFFPTKDRVFKIVDTILDGLPDLVEMPPEPNWAAQQPQGPTIGEISIRDGDRVIAEREIPSPEA